MALMLSKTRPELAVLIEKAVAAFEALSPEEKRQHIRAQRKSWVAGEMMLEHEDMTREQAEKLFEECALKQGW